MYGPRHISALVVIVIGSIMSLNCSASATHPDSLRVQTAAFHAYTDIVIAEGKAVNPRNIAEVVPIMEGQAGYVLLTRDRQSIDLNPEEMATLERELVKQGCGLAKPQKPRVSFGFGFIAH